MRFFYALLRPSGLVPEGLFGGKGKEQDRVSCETSCSKTARAREAKASVRVFIFRGGRGGGSSLRGSAFSPVRGFDLPCTGVSLPLYGQDNFPFMGVEVCQQGLSPPNLPRLVRRQ